MAIAPLQLPNTGQITPNVDWAPLAGLGKVYEQAQAKQALQQALGGGADLTDPKSLTALAARVLPNDATMGLSLASLANTAANTQYSHGRDVSNDAWRAQEAARAQQNADRSFGLQSRSADRADDRTPAGFEKGEDGIVRPIPNGPADPAYIKQREQASKTPLAQTASERAAVARQYGIEPASPEGKAFILNGEVPKTGSSLPEVVEQRKAVAAQLGMTPDSPGYQSYVATGKMPKEDAQPLTATDKKAILEADEKVQGGQQVLQNLQKAKTLSKQAFSGPGAGTRGYAASFLGESSDFGKGGIATSELHNVVTSNALQQLKTIFGGAPTEGERQILLDIQGSVNQPDQVRQKIYDRAIDAANKRLAFEQQRADELRGGTFYKKDGGTSKATTQPTGANGVPAPPQPGEVRGGYRFKGGNPGDPSNWAQVAE